MPRAMPTDALSDPIPTLAAPPGVRGVTLSGDPRIDPLLWTTVWNGYVTYSAPQHVEDYGTAGPGFGEFVALTPAQIALTQAILETTAHGQPRGGIGNSVEGFTDLRIDYLASDPGAGAIRVANSDQLPDGTAVTFVLGTDPSAGDVFFGADYRDPVAGNVGYDGTLHELGHALGLLHGQDFNPFGRLSSAWDGMEFTVMTYRSSIGGSFFTNETWGFPQTFMMLDIAALQHLYGADFTTNAGSTRYSWDPLTGESYVNGAIPISPGANRIFQTIWDGGGTDTYDLSNYATDLAIDLAPGGHSTFSAEQLAFLGGGGNGGYARGNVFNALQYHGDPRSLIENAFGGTGDDLMLGNAAANQLRGNAGADELHGGEGGDTLLGGDGADVLDGGAGADLMDGGRGADVYQVDDRGDIALELTGGAGDFVVASMSYRLLPGIEGLTLTGDAAVGSGNALANVIVGSEAANRLEGELGDDLLRGAGGDDVLPGGWGADELRGGEGSDRFVFDGLLDSTWRDFDVVAADGATPAMQGVGAAGGDVIDLSGLDANLLRPGDQAFVWNSTDVGGLSLVDAGDVTLVRGNLSRAAGFEFRLDIHDGETLAADYRAADFVL